MQPAENLSLGAKSGQETGKMSNTAVKAADEIKILMDLVWFRNDLRTLDNTSLQQACANDAGVIAVYCFDPRHAKTVGINVGFLHYLLLTCLSLAAVAPGVISIATTRTIPTV